MESKFREKLFKEAGIRDLGQFEVKSGKAMVSDPCYTIGTWCQCVVQNVKNGKWNAVVARKDIEGWGTRNIRLTAYHESWSANFMDWDALPFDICVDSGQAGIFDFDTYRNDEIATESKFCEKYVVKKSQHKDGDKWYGMCCDQTLETDNDAGIIPGGVVSSSGLGDGGYTACLIRNDAKEVIAIAIEFISENDDLDEKEPEHELMENDEEELEIEIVLHPAENPSVLKNEAGEVVATSTPMTYKSEE